MALNRIRCHSATDCVHELLLEYTEQARGVVKTFTTNTGNEDTLWLPLLCKLYINSCLYVKLMYVHACTAAPCCSAYM